MGTPGVEGVDLTVQTELAFGEWAKGKGDKFRRRVK